MKLITMITIKGHFDDGKEWTAKRAVCLDSFKAKGGTNECVKVLKVSNDCVLPDGEFTPLFDDRGRVADVMRKG